jgi:hypothetical protein
MRHTMAGDFHEQYAADSVPLPSDRSTGLVFTIVFLVIAYLWRDVPAVLTVALLVAALLLATSLCFPLLLRPLNIAWFKLALLLNKIVSPLVMLALFLVVVLPFGLGMQMLRDPLRKRRKAGAASFWIDLQKNNTTSSMSNQF